MSRAKWGAVFVCGASIACSNTGGGGEETLQHATEAVYRGTADDGPTSDPWRNAIVAVGSGANCTGFLVTSTLVLTANHCVNGDDENPPGTVRVGSTVFVGRDSQNWETTRPVSFIQTYLNGPTSDGLENYDLALLTISPPIVNEAYAQKPRLITPPLDGSIGRFPLFYAGWGGTENGKPRFRQLQFDHPDLHYVGGSAHGWFMNYESVDSYNGPFHGDSGGPLLWQYDPNDNNKWDVIGTVISGNVEAGNCPSGFLGIDCGKIFADWTDLTWTDHGVSYPNVPREGIGRWLRLVASNFAANADTARWIGETDYVGPCRTSVDPDCDRYISKAFGGTDVCPDSFNPEQLAGGDRDNDGVPDYCDNCPADPNPQQQNADGDSFGDACDLCAGSQAFTDCSSGCVGPRNFCFTYQDPTLADCYIPSENNVTCNQVAHCARPADTDGDAVGDDCDNCVSVKNTDQANCNEDAERSRNRGLLGDACDPVPCSRSTTQEVSYDRSFSSSACGPLLGTSCPVVVSADIAWQGSNNSATPISGTTTFAHCNCAAPHDSVDDRLSNCNTDSFGRPLCPLGRANAFPVASGAALVSGWHAISTTVPKPMSVPSNTAPFIRIDLSKLVQRLVPSTTPAAALNADHPTLYEQVAPTGRTRWLFDRDISRFGLSFNVPSGGISTASALQPLATAFEGMGWAFTNSYSGPSSSADLRSNYFAQDLNPRSRYGILRPNLPIAVVPPWIRPEPGACLGCSSARYPWISRVVDPALDPGQVIAIGIDTVQVIRPNFDPGLIDKLGRVGAGIALHVPSESDALIDRLNATERGAFIDATTRQITAIRAGSGGSLVSQVLPGTLAVLPDAAAFSAVRGELFALSQSENAEQLTIVDMRSASSTSALLSAVAKGVPLSATYRFADDSIYVLDRASASSGPLRLLRVTRSGDARDLGQIADPGFRTNFYLASTADDRLLVSAAGQAWDQPIYLELTTTDTAAQLVSVRYGDRPGALLLPPRATRTSGYATALSSALGGAPSFSDERRIDFTPTVATPLSNAVGPLRARSGLDNCTSGPLTASSNCAPLRALALYAARQLKVDDHASIRTSSGGYAPIESGGSSPTLIGADAQLGTVLSVAAIDVRDRAIVNGFLKSGGNVTRGNQVSVSGAITAQAALLPIPLAGFAAQFPASAGNDLSLEPDQISTIAPGSYADAVVKQRAKLRLSTGVYTFHSLDIEAGGTLALDTSLGPIFIYVETSLIYRGATITERGPSADLLLAVFGSDLVSIESSFNGTLVAPNASVNLRSVAAGHTGSFFGLDVELSPQTKITFAPFNYPWTP